MTTNILNTEYEATFPDIDVDKTRNKIKKVDLLVYGYEIPHDSVFYQGFRMMSYGGAFAWRLGAKRTKLLHIRDHFDKKFQRPFIVTFYLSIIGVTSIFLLAILDSLILHVVD